MPYKVYDKRVQECSGRASANKLRSFRIGFKAVMAAVYSRNTDLKLFGVEPYSAKRCAWLLDSSCPSYLRNQIRYKWTPFSKV